MIRSHRPLWLAQRGTVALLVALTAGCSSGGGDPTPAITAPSTGTVWGGTQAIRWVPAKSDGGTAQILLSADGGMTFSTVLAASTPDDGAFSFDTTGETDGIQYRVRLVLSDGPTLTSGDFAIDNTAPMATLTAPTGSEIWGGDNAITWTTTDVHPGTVEIRLSTNGGTSFDTVIAASTPDDGSFTWSSAPEGDGTTFRVRVTPTDEAGNAGAATESGANFELDNTAPIIDLTSPNGAESWSAQQTITWTTTDTNPGTVALTLSSNSGSTFPTSIAASAPDTGSYAWQTGEAPDGSTFRIRAVATDAAGNTSVADESAADFTMTNLRILGPVSFRDADQSGTINAGDQLYLKFDKNVTVTGAAASDLDLPVAGDLFGTGATVVSGGELDSVLVTLGTSPTLRPRGVFSTSVLTAGRPSGLDISASIGANVIESTATGLDAAPSGAKDVWPDVVATDLSITTAGTAFGGALGDVDGDGDLDLVTFANAGVGGEVFLGDGTGGFTSNGASTGLSSFGGALGDIDGDGDLDLIEATGAGARVHLGTGAGAFGAATATLGSGSVRAVGLADFDCDGDLDLFVGNTSSGPDEVYLGDGAGAFTTTGQSLGTGNTESLALGDIDGDGDLDVVAASNGGGQPVRAWMNNGSGTFSAGDAITVTAAQGVALGDLDGDGDLDVVVAVLGQNEVLLNDGAGNFGTTAQFFGNNDNRDLAVVDLDLDGDLDVVTVKDLDAERWWFNDGSGTLTEAIVRGAADNARAVLVGQLDGDADDDLLVVNDSSNHRGYFSSAAGMQPQAVYADAGLATSSLASTAAGSGDFDADGREDVLVVTAGGDLRRLPGSAMTTLGADVSIATNVGAVPVIADLNCDGNLDFVAVEPSSTTGRVYLGVGDGTFSQTQSGLALGRAAAGDVDGDGDIDVVAAVGGAQVFDNDGASTLTAAGAVFGPADTRHVLLDDADGDGDLDLYFATATQNQVWSNDGTGTFTFAANVGSARGNDLTLLDLDGDGDRDLVGVIASGAALLEPVRNDGSLSYTTLSLTGPSTNAGGALAVVDFDEDSARDLFIVDPATGGYSVYSNNGAGVFAATATSGTITNATGALALDADVDGDLDVYVSAGVMGAAAQDELHVLD